MSQELIDARARALYNKFWDQVGSDPQWLKGVLQDNPDILQRLLEAFTSSIPCADFQRVVAEVQGVAKAQARALATEQVSNPPFSLQWVVETLKNQ